MKAPRDFWRMRLGLAILFFAPGLATHAKPLYYTDNETGRILRAELNGFHPETVLVSLTDAGAPAHIRSLAIDRVNDYLYWTEDGSQNRVRRARQDGSAVETIVELGNVTPLDIEVDAVNQMIYWGGRNNITRARTDGTEAVNIVPYIPNLRNVYGLALDVPNNRLFFTVGTVGGPEGVWTMSLDGANPQHLIAQITPEHTFGSLADIELYNTSSQLYYIDEDDGYHFRIDANGANNTLRFDADAHPFAIAVDELAGQTYWTDWDKGNLWRANLDGTGQELLISGLPGIRGLALDVPIPEPATTTAAFGALGTLVVAHCISRVRRRRRGRRYIREESLATLSSAQSGHGIPSRRRAVRAASPGFWP